MEDQRSPFYTRPLLVAYPLDERGTLRTYFPEQNVADLSHKIPLDHRTTLIDKDGYTQGFAFANPENNVITFDLKQEYAKENPQALEVLWRSLVSQLSQNSEKPWSIAIQDEHTLEFIQQLQKQKLLQFDKKTTEKYPYIVDISLPKLQTNTRLMQTLKELSKAPPKTSKKAKLLPMISPNQPSP